MKFYTIVHPEVKCGDFYDWTNKGKVLDLMLKPFSGKFGQKKNWMDWMERQRGLFFLFKNQKNWTINLSIPCILIFFWIYKLFKLFQMNNECRNFFINLVEWENLWEFLIDIRHIFFNIQLILQNAQFFK